MNENPMRCAGDSQCHSKNKGGRGGDEPEGVGLAQLSLFWWSGRMGFGGDPARREVS